MTERQSVGEPGGGYDVIDLIGGRLEIVGRADAPGADAVIMRGEVPPGGGVPLHSHPDYECFHVLAGSLEVFIEGAGWLTVETGRSAVVARNERHAIRNSTDAPVELMIVVNNRLARFFQEAGSPGEQGAPLPPPTPEKIQQFLSVANRYGYWMASPQEDAEITGETVLHMTVRCG